MNTKHITLGKLSFDLVNFEEALQKLNTVHELKSLFVTTPNPEIWLHALSNPAYLAVLQTSDLSIPDGFGILWAARYLSGRASFLRWIWTLFTPWKTLTSGRILERITGTDLMQSMCQSGSLKKIFLLGASPEVNERLFQQLKRIGVPVVGRYSGDDLPEHEALIREQIRSSGAQILFVAFGAPKQEFWISRNLPFLPQIQIAMGVGGAFDFLSGDKKRAPHWMRHIGLEWLYRVMREPRRISRIFRATMLFPWKIYRLSKKDATIRSL